MKINVRYFTEIGSSSSTMEIDELASWIKRYGFKISSIEEAKRSYSEEEVKQMFNRYNEFIAHHEPEEWELWIDKQFKNK